MKLPVFVSQQAGKPILTGTLSAQEIITALQDGTMAVNPAAQRSLARGAGKESTRELLEADRAHKTARMAELVRFYLRVMECVEHGQQGQGFFGAIQLIIPSRFTGARLRFVEPDSGALPAGVTVALGALGRSRSLATLEADPALGETVFDISDGQGRCFGFYSFERAVLLALADKRARLRNKQDQGQATPAHFEELAHLEALRDRIRNFLSDTTISFVCYASAICDNGQLIGLDDDAERRLYIESNALNSQATKEEVIKYESFSPVVLALQEERLAAGNLWMDVEYIEEDSRVIGATSTKIFTLSTLVGAYSLSMLGHADPITRPDAAMFRSVAERREFVRAYWQKIAQVFRALWVPFSSQDGEPLRGSERQEYLILRRAERNVAFQAIFLLALGRLGSTLGKMARWQRDSALLDHLDRLKEKDYRAYLGADPGEEDPSQYSRTWVAAMMKPRIARGSRKKEGYAFQHSHETIMATHDLLFSMLELKGPHPSTEPEPPARAGSESALPEVEDADANGN
ncbi:MAG TPA: hypothetical protein VKN99_05015 [Polyangia bacterium]|nr:hypothetical protein [Polyangia bacterium]